MENSEGQNLAGDRRAARDLLSMYPSFNMLPACAERRPSQEIAAIAAKVQASGEPETNYLAGGFRQISALDIPADHAGRRWEHTGGRERQRAAKQRWRSHTAPRHSTFGRTPAMRARSLRPPPPTFPAWLWLACCVLYPAEWRRRAGTTRKPHRCWDARGGNKYGASVASPAP